MKRNKFWESKKAEPLIRSILFPPDMDSDIIIENIDGHQITTFLSKPKEKFNETP